MEPLATLHVAGYALAALLYLAYHAGARDRLALAGRAVLAVAFGLHVLDIGVRCLRGAHPASSTPEAMAFIAWILTAGFLIASFRYRAHAAGAFAVPGALVLLLLARVVPAAGGPPPAGWLGVTHVLLATLGVALFGMAAVVAALYLLQERRLKRRAFHELAAGAPLDTLDRLGARCVSIGFPLFTVAIVTGAVWVARLGMVQDGGALRPEYLFAAASWLAFGVLLVARAGVGWRGRRAAWLTVAGFAGALLVVAGYFVRYAA